MKNKSVDQRKKWTVLFEPNLKIKTQEKHLRKFWELFYPLEVKAQLPKFLETEGCAFSDALLTVYPV